jgi:hypothetical protein
MAVLGYCMVCEKLVNIRPGSQEWGSRKCHWYPIPHDDPKTGEACGGDKKEIK